MKKKDSNSVKNQPAGHTGFVMWLVCNLWQRELKKALLQLDLTHAQYILLQAACELGKEKNAITQINLAQRTGTDKMMVSKILRTLEKKKLLKRADMKTDNRAKNITVTTKGNSLYLEAATIVHHFEKKFFSPVMKNEKTVHKSLLKILKQNGDGK